MATLRKHLVPAASRYLGSAVIALSILLLFWPGGQLKPFASASRTLATVTQYNWTMPVFFEGSFHNATDLPFYYILKMMVLKIPIIILVLFAGTAVYYFWKNILRKNHQAFRKGNALGVGMVIFSVLFPLLYVLAKDSVLYNGMRHLLFILPPMCAIAAWGLTQFHSWMKQARPRLVVPAGSIFILTLLLTAVQMVRLHPYQYIYYNELAGGTTKAAQRYETDYWGTVYKELAEDFYDHLVATKPAFNKPEVVVNMEHVTYLFAPFLPEQTTLPIRVLRSQPDLDDYYAASTTWAADTFYAGRPVVQVQRVGTVLGIIKDRRGLSPEERVLGYDAEEAGSSSSP